jgi:mitochondrial enoyl-[acyl-carrier protein] reductase / trans-2-enoyl-CoA reductase
VRAVLIPRFGLATEVADVVDLPDPGPPGPGQVLLDILAAPINPSDFLVFQGRFGAVPPPLPAAAGGEAVGQVAAVGPDVEHLRVGDRVLALHAGRGNWRQRVLAPATPIRPLPAAADVLQLAMLGVNPATALHMLTRFVSLSPGMWVIQNAGNSAVAHCVVQLARCRGLRTVSVVRRADQVRSGADFVLVDGPDLAVRVAAATGGAPIRLGLDAVAGEATSRLSRCLAPGGTLVVYGLLSSPDCTVSAADLVFRDITLRGYWFTPWFEQASAEDIAATYAELGSLVLDGTIRVAIEATYPLERVREALAHAARPGRKGKVLLLPNPGML